MVDGTLHGLGKDVRICLYCQRPSNDDQDSYEEQPMEIPLKKQDSGSFDGLKKMFSNSRMSRRSTITDETTPFMRHITLSLTFYSSKRPEDLLRSSFSYSHLHDPDTISITHYNSDDEDSGAEDDDDTKSVVSMSVSNNFYRYPLFSNDLDYPESPRHYPFPVTLSQNERWRGRGSDEDQWMYRTQRSASVDSSAVPRLPSDQRKRDVSRYSPLRIKSKPLLYLDFFNIV